MFFVETINVLGINTIFFLQSSLPGWEEFFMNVSKLGDPGLAFTFYLPLVSSLNVNKGQLLLLTLIICEWMNMILKWVLAGDRPFWWVREADYYIHKNAPSIKQFELTCETGPGMPSGHSTLNAALFFSLAVFGLSLLLPFLRKYLRDHTCRTISYVVWTAYGIWVLLVMMSRVYIAAHFPHQCITGVLIGICTVLIVDSVGTKFAAQMTNQKSFLLTAIILLSVGLVFGVYRAFGNDPMWSHTKAVRWCIDRNYIHMDSTPFYALSRYSGLSLGLGLALSSSHFTRTDASRFTWKMTASLLVLSMMIGQASSFFHRALPSTITGFYAIEFGQNALLAYLVIAFLPYFVSTASGVKPKAKIKSK